MSWELVSFLILAAVLVAGFAWYERSRPPAQVVALVAALAALAIAGRVALGAFPNVKPLTTDVIVFAGFALGGAPGFAVGALAALVSNFWFGQGPWTPWQMAGWGLCGILGALLALGWRNAGRFTLAATCGLAAVLYGALLNFSLMATYGGELSWQRFWAFEAQAVPFEIAHAGGNIVFALVAGPAMVRMLVRFRERFEWRRGGAPGGPPDEPDPRPARPVLRSGVAALLLIALAATVLAPAVAHASAVSRAAAYLESQQNSDGGFGPSPGEGSGAETTCWAMLGLEAAGTNPLDVSRSGRTPVDYLRARLGDLKSPGDLARTILALEGAGVDPRGFGGENLVSELLAKRRKDGSYEGWPGSTAFAVIALRAAGIEGVTGSMDWLRENQNSDGGWGDVAGSPSTADGTGAVLQALSPGSKAANRALGYLTKEQRNGGGFSLGGNGTVNTQSTAWAVQGIRAVGGHPDSFRRGGASAPEYLAANQEADGSYRYSKPGGSTPDQVAHQTPVWVTGQVLVAASGKYFPIAAPARAPKPKPSQKSSSVGSVPLPSSSPPLPSTGSGPPGVSKVPPSGQAGGSPPGHSAESGEGAPGASAVPPLPGEGVPEGTTGLAPGETSVLSPSDTAPPEEGSDDSSSVAGAILLGLLAGCLLFGVAWAGRRGWMRWRYGL
jgi:energy-coupling factor transport system substrate-specific component